MKKIAKKTYEKLYPIILSIFIVIITFLYKDIKNEPKKFGLFMLITMPFWYGWTLLMNNYTSVPAWCFAKYSVVGISFLNTTLEDWFFYPVCCWLSYLIIKRIKVKDFANSNLKIFPFSILLLSIVFFSLLDFVGLTISGILIFPFLLVFIIVNLSCDNKLLQNFNLKQLLIFSIISLTFSTCWDLHSTTWKLHIANMVEWYYPRDNGMFSTKSWAWIGNSPISITPYLTIAGIFVNYTVYLILNKGVKE